MSLRVRRVRDQIYIGSDPGGTSRVSRAITARAGDIKDSTVEQVVGAPSAMERKSDGTLKDAWDDRGGIRDYTDYTRAIPKFAIQSYATARHRSLHELRVQGHS